MSGANVVLFLPDIGGSELYAGEEFIWPGNASDIICYPDSKLQKLIDCPLEAKDIVRTILDCPYYQTLIDYLNSLGYDEGPSAENPLPSLFVFPYDWRRDLTHVARDLADVILQTRAAYDGLCSITLLSHGGGGLIARCMLEAGSYDDVLGDARKSILQLIMIGAGGTGAPEALSWIVGLEGFLILSADQTQRLAACSQRPVFYQYLPAPGAAFLWSSEDRGAQFDLYSDQVSRNLQLDQDRLACAIDFWGKLAFPDAPSVGPRYFGFVGVQTSTVIGFAYDAKCEGAKAMTPVEADYAGDGLIPIWSADHPRFPTQYVAGPHSTLFDDDELRATLAALLPAQSTTVPSAPEVVQSALHLFIRSPIVRKVKRNGGQTYLVISLRKRAEAPMRGVFVAEKRAIPGQKAESDRSVDGNLEPLKKLELNHSGFFALSLDVSRLAPGPYRMSFQQEASEPAARGVGFIVLKDRRQTKRDRTG